MKDIFEDLKEKLGCENVSDLCYGEKQIWAKGKICKMDLSEYKLSDLEDVADYIYNQKVKFISVEQAKEFFDKNR